MTKNDFNNLKIGDYVQVTQHGQNKGKIGRVEMIRPRSLNGGSVYLSPYNCAFTFSAKSNRRQQIKGLTSFPHESVKYLGDSPVIPEKEFYVAAMFGEEGVSWPTTNFTETELTVINRFLKELNEHACTMTIDSIVILDADD